MKIKLIIAMLGFGIVGIYAFLTFWVTRPEGVVLSLSFEPVPNGQSFHAQFYPETAEILFLFYPINSEPSVTINGQTIHYRGYPYAPLSSLQGFYSVKIPLMEEMLESSNTLSIRFSGDEDFSERFPSPILMTQSQYLRHDRIVSLINVHFSMYATGSMILLGFILFVLGKSVEQGKRKAYLFMSAGILASAASIIPGILESIHLFSAHGESPTLIYYFRYLGFSFSLVLILKSLGILFFHPVRFSSRIIWIIPAFPIVIFASPVISIPTLLLPMNVLFAFLVLFMGVISFQIHKGLTIAVFFMFGCIIYSLILYPVFFRFLVSPPFLRDHGIAALIFSLGFLLVHDYRKIMSLEKKARAELRVAYGELNQSHEELENAYQTQDQTLSKLQRVIDLSGRMGSFGSEDPKVFVHDVLQMTRELIPESDYAFARYWDLNDWAEEWADPFPEIDVSIRSEYAFDIGDGLIHHRWETKHPLNKGKQSHKGTVSIHLPSFQEIYITVLDEQGSNPGVLGIGINRGSPNSFSTQVQEVLQSIRNIASAFFVFQRMAWMQESFHTQIIHSVVNILEIHDISSRGHSESVAYWSQKIAEQLEMPPDQVKQVFWAALVHDIGKILIPQAILHKISPLTRLEYEVIKQHPIWAYQVLSESPELQFTRKGVYHHHERFNGTGYPEELMGEEIPVVSRIIAVADAWDAMRREKPYRNARTDIESIRELTENQGSQFDPRIVQAFLKVRKGDENHKA